MGSNLGTIIAFSFIGLAVFWFLLLITDSWRLRRLRRKYIEYDDSSKQGEQRRKKGAGEFGRVPAVTERELFAEGLSQFKRDSLLPPATPSPIREDITSSGAEQYPAGKTSNSSRNFFNRLHKR